MCVWMDMMDDEMNKKMMKKNEKKIIMPEAN